MANKKYKRLQHHVGGKIKNVFCFVRKLERYLLITDRSAILSYVHSPPLAFPSLLDRAGGGSIPLLRMFSDLFSFYPSS